MAKYTTSIQTLLKNNFDLGLQDYPIFDEKYRSTLNNNILSFYYNDEIAFETAQLFKYHLNAKMNIIMPKYNTLYKSYLNVQDNLFDNVNLKESLNRNTTSDITNNGKADSSSTSTNNSDGKNIYQETPQGKIFAGEIDSINWATNATLDNSKSTNDIMNESTSESNSNGTSHDEYIKTISGNNGKTYNIELLKYIETNLKNIDMLIINELEDLFFGLL